VLHAAFVSSLHKIIGIEFGAEVLDSLRLFSLITPLFLAAYFVQNVVSSYETRRAALPEPSESSDATTRAETDVDLQGKECSNLMVLLSELYNFQVISSVLVFDIIRDLLDQKLTEFNVELLLKVVRST
jgi:nucleolar MIF4G domain-containing protein 1